MLGWKREWGGRQQNYETPDSGNRQELAKGVDALLFTLNVSMRAQELRKKLVAAFLPTSSQCSFGDDGELE